MKEYARGTGQDRQTLCHGGVWAPSSTFLLGNGSQDQRESTGL
jgi:hypothetical protein